jgi:rhodanese-related sulfurtransferase
MKTITPLELQTILTAQPSVLVIDMRTPVEFAEVHVP